LLLNTNSDLCNGIPTNCCSSRYSFNRLCGRPPQYAPAPMTLTSDFENGVWVTCDVGYLCANFSLPRPLCSQVRPDVCDRRQTSSSLNAPT